ncbi:MAG: HEAT repeat domain-containing protein [Methylococcaceae bacterium]|jgi:hypothetical protein
MILTIIIGLLASACVNLALYRSGGGRAGSLVGLYRRTLMLLVVLTTTAAAGGTSLNPHLVMLCYLFGLGFLVIETLGATFWRKMACGTLTVAYLMLGGYLYTITQIPFGARPFSFISSNQPRPLIARESPIEWISGLPVTAPESYIARTATTAEVLPAATPRTAAPVPVKSHVDWPDLSPLIAHDSHIRDVLIALRQKQTRELTETLANLNQISVTGTSMRRHAIARENIENMLQDGAISQARYHTLLETWLLADKDEQAFRARQGEDLFHALLGLLEDKEVAETHKVELINFMVSRFAEDVRLVRPLINLYNSLDEDYPRQKRLNREFMSLYLQKRRAILRGFEAISSPVLQPLLDYRKKTVSELRYSQTALDQFLERKFQVKVRPLYGMAEPLSIRNFLNREKYPRLEKFSGPAYGQDYLRRNLNKIAAENQVPPAGKPVMELSQSGYEEIVRTFAAGIPDRIDSLMIDPDPAIRGNVAWHLAERKDPYTVPLVFELMQDSHPEVRRLAAIAIGNFKILDMQSSSDRKFIEIVRMLINYRTNADAYARAFALSALATVGDPQKGLYVIDLVLNDGTTSNSLLGNAAPAWRDEAEKAAVQSLVETLTVTPEEPYIKTHALKVLMAMDLHESLGILLHTLRKVYQATGARPGMLRYIVPHMTLPQQAENVEDMMSLLASAYRKRPAQLQQPLKTLRAYLSDAYEHHRSAEFFQYMRFMEDFAPGESSTYAEQSTEHVLVMQITEYFNSTWKFWLILWPLALLGLILLQYGLGLFGNVSRHGSNPHGRPNRYANPAADIRNRRQSPAAAVVPIKISTRHP